MQTVGVCGNSVWLSYPTHMKADEGAERSSRRRRGSRRGQRRKMRSRSLRRLARRQTSLETTASTPDDNMSARVLKSHLRACDHWYERVQQFGKRLSLAKVDFSVPAETMGRYAVWKDRWRVLRNRILPYGEGVVWCSRIGPTFSYYLEQQHGIVVRGSSAQYSLRVIRENLSVGEIVGSWCRIVEQGCVHPLYPTARIRPPDVLTKFPSDLRYCACKVCRPSTICPSDHGIGSMVWNCSYCDYTRHSEDEFKKRRFRKHLPKIMPPTSMSRLRRGR